MQTVFMRSPVGEAEVGLRRVPFKGVSLKLLRRVEPGLCHLVLGFRAQGLKGVWGLVQGLGFTWIWILGFQVYPSGHYVEKTISKLNPTFLYTKTLKPQSNPEPFLNPTNPQPSKSVFRVEKPVAILSSLPAINCHRRVTGPTVHMQCSQHPRIHAFSNLTRNLRVHVPMQIPV